jgi:hypothetical protein
MKELANLGLHRIRTLLGPHLADATVLSGSRYRLFTLPLGMREGLFYVDIFRVLHGPDGREAMPMIASRYHDGIDVRIAQ